MRCGNDIRKATPCASPEWQGTSNRAIRRALRESLKKLRSTELELLEQHPRSAAALRLAAVRTEFCRLEHGLVVRPASVVRAISGLRPIIPIRPENCLQRREVSECLTYRTSRRSAHSNLRQIFSEITALSTTLSCPSSLGPIRGGNTGFGARG